MNKSLSHSGTSLQIQLRPIEALVDTPVAIQLSGFPAGQPVTIRAQMANYLNSTWESYATSESFKESAANSDWGH